MTIKTDGKIQLTMEVRFISVIKDSNKKSNKDSYYSYPIHIHNDSSFIFIRYEANNIINKLFKSLLEECQESLKINLKRSDLVFDSVDVLYYKFHKISLNRSGSYIDSPKWLNNKKATINPRNKKDDQCFPYAIATALNHQYIKKDLQRISKIMPFIDQYNWKEISFALHKGDWNNFEKNNKSITLNVLFVSHNTKQIRHAYLSKHNSDRKNQVILLMIIDGKK